jgi:hypothetical protein
MARPTARIAASSNRHALDGQRTPKVSSASCALIPPRMAIATLFSVDALARAAATASVSTSAGIMSTPSRSPKIRSPGAMRIPSISTGVRKSITFPRGPWSCA